MGVPITFLDRHNTKQFEIVGITKPWAKGRTKIYPRQTQISANGKKTGVTKLNDGAALKIDATPQGKTHYMVDNSYFIQVYARILIRRKIS